MEEIYIEQTNPKTIFKTIMLIFFALGILIGGYLYFHNKNILRLKNVTIELGEKIPDDIEFYVRNDVKNIKDFDLEIINIPTDKEGNATEIGEYKFIVKYNSQEKAGKARVKDTTPPKVTLKTLTVGVSEEFLMDDFIETCEDLSLPCKATLKNKKDNKLFSKIGTHNITLNISDKYNNIIEKEVTFTVTNNSTLLTEKENDFIVVKTDPEYEDYDGSITFKYEKCVSEELLDELEEYNDYLELVSTDYSELRSETIIDQEIITLYNKYDYIIGFTVKLTYENGTVEYVE